MSTTIIDHHYDSKMHHPMTREYYGQSAFFNFGYWRDDTRDQKEACEELIEQLLAFIPEQKGKILDVACGMGATTNYLMRYYQPTDVIGVNISTWQLKTCQENAPGCAFLGMDAAALGFADQAFDAVICVEAAFHFQTRRDFLREAYRVLKPGGYLILSDILTPRWARNLNRRLPRRNWVKNIDAYYELYRQIGFKNIEVIDATNECWTRFYQHAQSWRHEKFRARQIAVLPYTGMILRNGIANAGLKHYLLVSASKEALCR